MASGERSAFQRLELREGRREGGKGREMKGRKGRAYVDFHCNCHSLL